MENNAIQITVRDGHGLTVITGHHEVQGFVIDESHVVDKHGQSIVEKEAVDEALADALSGLGWSFAALCDRSGEHIRPDVVRAAAEAFVSAGNTCVTEEPEDFTAFQSIDPLIFGQLLLQVIGEFDPRAEGERLNRTGKLAAADTAEVLGPDWAQVLYRFAVLCTKLA